MVSKFILPYGQLNLAFLISEKRKTVYRTRLLEEEAVEIFEYGKNNDGYENGAKLNQQVVNKALPIAKAFYLGYSLLFLFDNETNHSIYAKDTL